MTLKTRCGLSSKHSLSEENTTITSTRLLEFAKKINRDFRSTTRICKSCLQTLEKVYNVKIRKAMEKKTKQVHTVSSVSSTTLSHESLTQRYHISRHQTSETTSHSSSLSDGPTTSAAAAARAQARMSTSIHSIDDDEYMPSPNALNGTRLPHVQPAPKRRQFVHLNKHVMDVYLSGTTGG